MSSPRIFYAPGSIPYLLPCAPHHPASPGLNPVCQSAGTQSQLCHNTHIISTQAVCMPSGGPHFALDQTPFAALLTFPSLCRRHPNFSCRYHVVKSQYLPVAFPTSHRCYEQLAATGTFPFKRFCHNWEYVSPIKAFPRNPKTISYFPPLFGPSHRYFQPPQLSELSRCFSVSPPPAIRTFSTLFQPPRPSPSEPSQTFQATPSLSGPSQSF